MYPWQLRVSEPGALTNQACCSVTFLMPTSDLCLISVRCSQNLTKVVVLNITGMDSKASEGGLLSCKRNPEAGISPPTEPGPFFWRQEASVLVLGSSNFGVSSWLEDTFYSPPKPIYNE